MYRSVSSQGYRPDWNLTTFTRSHRKPPRYTGPLNGRLAWRPCREESFSLTSREEVFSRQDNGGLRSSTARQTFPRCSSINNKYLHGDARHVLQGWTHWEHRHSGRPTTPLHTSKRERDRETSRRSTSPTLGVIPFIDQPITHRFASNLGISTIAFNVLARVNRELLSLPERLLALSAHRLCSASLETRIKSSSGHRRPSAGNASRMIPVLSPIPERASDSGDLRSLMDDSLNEEDESLRAETSHMTPKTLSNAEILRHAFYKDDEESLEDDEEALSSSIAVISGKLSLEDAEIADAGAQRPPGTFRYRLVSPLLDKQIQGSSNPQQIRVAWDLLRVRVGTGERFFNKYLSESENGHLENTSPASTASSMLEGFALMDSQEQKLKHLVTYYPRHKEELNSASERLQLLFSDWNMDINIPTDTRNITHRSSRLRNSWPDDDQVNSKEFGEDCTVFSPVPTADALDLIPNQYNPSPLKVPSVGSLGTPLDASLVGPQRQYKSSASFLDQMANQSEIAIHLVPNAVVEPNVLDNLISGPLGSEGERFKATFGSKKAEHTYAGKTPQFALGHWRSRPNNPFSSSSPTYTTPNMGGPFDTPVTPIPLKGDFSFVTPNSRLAPPGSSRDGNHPMLAPSIGSSFAATTGAYNAPMATTSPPIINPSLPSVATLSSFGTGVGSQAPATMSGFSAQAAPEQLQTASRSSPAPRPPYVPPPLRRAQGQSSQAPSGLGGHFACTDPEGMEAEEEEEAGAGDGKGVGEEDGADRLDPQVPQDLKGHKELQALPEPQAGQALLVRQEEEPQELQRILTDRYLPMAPLGITADRSRGNSSRSAHLTAQETVESANETPLETVESANETPLEEESAKEEEGLVTEQDKRSAHLSSGHRVSEDETMYDNAFTVLLNQTLASSNMDFSRFESAAPATTVLEYKTANAAKGEIFSIPPSPSSAEKETETHHTSDTAYLDTRDITERRRSIKKPKPWVEEVEDEEKYHSGILPEDPSTILEDAIPATEDSEMAAEIDPELVPTNWHSRVRAQREEKRDRIVEAFWLNDGGLFPEDANERREDEEDFGEAEFLAEELEWKEARATQANVDYTNTD
ncbi:hypothetical protein C8R46DRAFT_1050303 [Mycena filopes]|nr:hypothetical protein C8R46DRAFT_1050303 [Mycena filopes]